MTRSISEATAPREWRFYVEDMLSFIDKAPGYAQGVDQASFTLDSMRYDATLQHLLTSPHG